MDLGLKGKVALVTASSRGIGLGVAKVLASEGVRVVINGRDEEALRKAKEEIIRETGGEVHAVRADLTVKKDVERLIDEARRAFGRIDILVYNTGPPKPGTFMELTDEDWEYATRLLLLNAVWLTKRVISEMIERRWGRLIYITSLTLRQVMPNLVLSNVVRLSIAGLVKSLAVEFGGYGITSNGIMQGLILTDRLIGLARKEALAKGMSVEDVLNSWCRDIPVGRLGRPEDIGYLVAFLASDKASYINGAMILIDGGYVKCVF